MSQLDHTEWHEVFTFGESNSHIRVTSHFFGDVPKDKKDALIKQIADFREITHTPAHKPGDVMWVEANDKHPDASFVYLMAIAIVFIFLTTCVLHICYMMGWL